MDDRLKREHDFKKTIAEAAYADDEAVEARRRERLQDELSYALLAINSSMGMFGMEETTAELIQLEMAQEFLYRLNEDETPDDNV